jgi:hypothetical protein
MFPSYIFGPLLGRLLLVGPFCALRFGPIQLTTIVLSPFGVKPLSQCWLGRQIVFIL